MAVRIDELALSLTHIVQLLLCSVYITNCSAIKSITLFVTTKRLTLR